MYEEAARLLLGLHDHPDDTCLDVVTMVDVLVDLSRVLREGSWDDVGCLECVDERICDLEVELDHLDLDEVTEQLMMYGITSADENLVRRTIGGSRARRFYFDHEVLAGALVQVGIASSYRKALWILRRPLYVRPQLYGPPPDPLPANVAAILAPIGGEGADEPAAPVAAAPEEQQWPDEHAEVEEEEAAAG